MHAFGYIFDLHLLDACYWDCLTRLDLIQLVQPKSAVYCQVLTI